MLAKEYGISSKSLGKLEVRSCWTLAEENHVTCNSQWQLQSEGRNS